MKTIKESSGKQWWIGRTLECSCGFSATIEDGDYESDLFSVSFLHTLHYDCKCGRGVVIEPIDEV